jgi:hypothetical protein
MHSMHIIGLLGEAEQIIPAITFERQDNGEAGRILPPR